MSIHNLSSKRFGEQADKALGDQQLKSALDNATSLIGERRAAAVANVPNWEELREHARLLKAEVIDHLDEYLGEFVQRAEEAGIIVHFARTPAEAHEIFLEIAKAPDDGAEHSRTVVKSKSMVAEEIGLNEVLEDAGLEPIETDLGEYIVQLAKEPPSHIIVPAIHKSKADIARLFEQELGIEPTTDEKELTAVARRILRRSFAEAELGISGVNFAIAETGSILILENEGNIRLTTSLPRIHVALMGIEKVIPRFEDLEVFLRILPRSGTGQHLTSYQSILTGPKRRPTDDGPQEVHIVVLDNGRSAMLSERVTRQTLNCIRCGACLNACPVYQQIGGHAYGSVYPGPIGAILTPQLAGLDQAAQLPYASSLCGACRDVCPVKIDIPQVLLHLRAKIAENRELPGRPGKRAPARGWPERFAFRLWSWTMRSPWRNEWSARLSGPFQRLVLSSPRLLALVGRAIPPLRAWTTARELRPPARRSFRERWSELVEEDSR